MSQNNQKKQNQGQSKFFNNFGQPQQNQQNNNPNLDHNMHNHMDVVPQMSLNNQYRHNKNQNQNFMPQQQFMSQQHQNMQNAQQFLPNFGKNQSNQHQRQFIVNGQQPQYQTQQFVNPNQKYQTQQFSVIQNPQDFQPIELTVSQAHMLTMPFTYPENSVVNVQYVSTQEPELSEYEMLKNMQMQIMPMPLDPLAIPVQLPYYAANQQDVINGPQSTHEFGFVAPLNSYKNLSGHQQNISHPHSKPKMQNQQLAPNPFYQPDFATQQFVAPIQQFNQGGKQVSFIQAKLDNLENLLLNNLITPNEYQARKKALIENEIGEFTK